MEKIYSNSDEKFLRTTIVHGSPPYLYTSEEAAVNEVVSERLDAKTVKELFKDGFLIRDALSLTIKVPVICTDYSGETYCKVATPNHEVWLGGDSGMPHYEFWYSSEYTG